MDACLGRATTIVLLCDVGQVNGGAVQVAALSACELARRGFRVIFVAGSGEADARLAGHGVEVRSLGLQQVWERRNPVGAAVAGIWSRVAWERLTSLLASLDPERTVVHAHQWTKSLSPSVFAAVRASGLPLLITLHDYFACCPNGLLYRFDVQRSCPHRPLSPACLAAGCDRDGWGHKLVRLARQVAIQAQLAGGHPTFLHVSEFARRRAGPFLPEHAVHRVVPNPCLVTRAPPAMPHSSDSFAFIGRFTPEKGVAVLAEALRGSSAKLTALGAGPLGGTLRAASPKVTVLPWGAPSAVLDLLERSRALLFPSLWAETQGLVVSEALARGVPVIAARDTGAAELVERTGGGILVPSGDAGALAEAIARLQDPVLAARLGKRAYDGYWSAPQTVEAHVRALTGAYADAIARHARAKRQGRPARWASSGSAG